MKSENFRRIVAWVVMFTLTLTQTAQVAALTLATSPLAASTTSVVRPNLMYVLDDSGSMAWDYTPDYINDATTAADPGSQGGTAGDGVRATISGGVVTSIVATSPPFNTAYRMGAPAVVIQGGGGVGASAVVTLNASNIISSITVTDGGTGYTSVPYVALVGGMSTAAWGMCWGTTSNNAGGIPKDTVVSPTCTTTTQPPYAAAPVNYQFYDPAVRYEQPLHADGTRYGSALGTVANWTAAKTDGFAGTGSTNLTSSWTHEVWCSTATPSPAPTAVNMALLLTDPLHPPCRENLDTSNNTLYPNATYTFRKTYLGAASYYTMDPTWYCTDDTMTDCQRSTTPVVIGAVVYNVPGKYRWCSFYNPLTHAYGNCQGNRDLSHYVPDYLGGWVSTGSAGVQATATFTIDSVVDGQSLTGLTIGGVDVVGGLTFVANSSSTTTTIAESICNAIQANVGSSGYGCAQTGNSILLQAAIAGTAANGAQVLATGPAAVAATNSLGSIEVVSAIADYEISGITVNRADLTTAQLISSTVTSDGNTGNTAQFICQAINSGPNQGLYIARSGNPADPLLLWGICNSTVDAWVGIKRVPADQTDNLATITVTGPPTGPRTTGTISINSTGGETRISDITQGGVSILTAKPLDYADGTLTTTIATDVASKISAAGCTATSSGRVVTLTGTCAGALAVVATGASATGTFRVAPGSSGKAGDLGGISVNTANLVGHVTSSQISDSSAATTNSATLRTLLNNATGALSGGVGPHGFTAAAPVASGVNYDITVTAPAGNSYNNQSFTFSNGTASGAAAGAQPSWTFNITGATTDSKTMTSIKCGATDTITPSSASTGTASAGDYIANLATGAGTNSLNGRSFNNYSYACTAGGSCTLTGPSGAAACNTPAVAPLMAVSADATITLGNWVRTGAGTTGTPSWTFNITGAGADSKSITGITCGGTDVIVPNVVSTGAPSAYIANLTSTAGGLNTKTANSYTWACAVAGTCTLTGPAGASACAGGLTVTAPGITTTQSVAVAGVAAGSNSWAFTFTDAQTDSRSVSQVRCGPTAGAASTSSGTRTLNSSHSTGTSSAPTSYAANLATSLMTDFDPDGGSHWTFGGGASSFCTPNAGAGTVSCTFQKTAPACTTTPVVTLGAGLTLNSGPTLSGSDWSFTIGGATAANRVVTSITCLEAVASNATTVGAATGDGGGSLSAPDLATDIVGALNPTYWDIGNSNCTGTGSSSSDRLVTCNLKPVAAGICDGATAPTINGSGMTWGSATLVSSKWQFSSVVGTMNTGDGISSITCPSPTTEVNAVGPSTGTTGSSASTDTQKVQRLENLRLGLHGESRNSFTWSCPTAATDAGGFGCTITGPSSCTSPTLYFLGSNNPTNIFIGGTNLRDTGQQFGTYTAAPAATSPVWNFGVTAPVSGTAGDNLTINSITCGGTNTFNTAALPNTGVYGYTRINTLASLLAINSANSYTTACSPAATLGSSQTTCTITGPANTAAACTNMVLSTTDSSIVATQPSQAGAAGSTRPTWTFDITNATTANKTIGAITCNGTNTFDTASLPSTGNSTLTQAQRVTNLTKGAGTGLESIGLNGYSTSCQTATTGNIPGSPGIQCTVTGPAGPAACTPLTILPEAASGISVGASTQTSAGSGPIAAVEDFQPFLSTVSAFTGGSAAQGATAVGVTTATVGTIVTSTTSMSNGTAPSTLTIATNADGTAAGTLTMSGGAVADAATNHWTSVGIFKRTDIVVTNNSYNRASGRTDCVGATCTYNEEIQNFANWYSYYRTRMLMMKSATTLAFSTLDGKYRIGYDNICSSTGTTVLREAKQFVDTGGEAASHRTNWWNTMTSESPSCATPLRSEVTKIGRYYAGTLSAAIDPLQYSCQQNFLLLVTDGYWNEAEATMKGVTGADIGNVDNSLTTTERPYYDGAQASTTCPTISTGNRSGNSSCRTLADIAHYYYNTDLRASPFEVTATTSAAHGLKNGQTYAISGASPAGYNGDVVVYVTGATTFTFQLAGTTPNTSPGAYVASSGTINTDKVIVTATHGAGHFSNATNPSAVDVSKNNVTTSANDKNQLQHMNFYAMGLGIDGSLQYRSDYKTAGTGDFAEINAGTKNWPAVANYDPTAVDDLWHATVNGHGKYFSARNLPNVVAGLREALNEIGARTGSAAAAATSNLRPVAGDNFAYVASYGTVDWVGDLQSRTIDSAGNVSPDTNCGVTGSGCTWSAQGKLDNLTFSARRIYVAPTSDSTGTALRAFTYDNLTGAEQAFFNPGTAPALSQYASLVVSNPGDITAENLVNFLRGERRLEQDGNISHAQIWRKRAHVFGDIVNSQPVYVKTPNETYADAGFNDSTSSFRQSGAAVTRAPVVYVSAQDGMLHAFNAHSAAVTVSGATVQPGEEMWAYIPKQAMATMRVLADVNYSHRYFVDGPVTVASVNFGVSSNDWHTILIGSQFGGGTSYFALDVTDPLNPLYLWEFTDSTKLGYTFGNPVVSKLPNGEWAVFFTSGFNNADGVGYLFAVNPKTGVLKTGYPISNGSGSGAFPSNLGKLAIETLSRSDNTALYMYAGDLNGDLWRFNPSPTAAVPAYFKLAHLTNAASTAQPITTKPELAKQSNGVRSVFVGTGKYLENNQPSPPGVSDLTNTDVQSIYAIKDTVGASNLGGAGQDTWNPQTDTVTVSGSPVNAFHKRELIGIRADGSVIKDSTGTKNVQMICKGKSSAIGAPEVTVTTVSGTDVCNNESTEVLDWNIHGGWYVNFPDAGERMNVDPILVKSTLLFAGNTPSASSCTSGGEAWLTALDYSTGLEVPGSSKKASTRVAGAVVVGLSVIILGSGEVKVIVTKSDYTQETLSVPIAPDSASTFGNKRSLWREFEAY